MTDSTGPLTELCERWEQAFRRGGDPSPEELCPGRPELHEELRKAIAALRAAAKVIGTPGPDSTAPYEPEDDDDRRAPDLPAGCRYRILRFHARGGLGRVFVARDEELGREVALKFVRPGQSWSQQALRRFRREAEVTGRLEHAGVVPVHGLVHLGADGSFCYAMRFLEGQTLQAAVTDFHAPGGPAGNGEACREALRRLLGHFVAVCNTVAFAHERRVLHRDLKPANVMLGRFGETWVLDWGLARWLDRPDAEDGGAAPGDSGEDTQAGTVLGTPGFMSPEQARGELSRLGAASDVYSLGAVLGTILVGRPTAPGETVAAWLDAARGPSAPPALVAVCRRATAERPEDRYPSAKALADEVERWLADEPVGAYREPLSQRLRRWARRRPRLVTASAAGLVVALLALSVGTVLIDRQRKQTDAQRARADQNFALADEAATDILMSVVEHPRLRQVDFHGPRRELLSRAVALHEKLAEQQPGDHRTLSHRARAYARLGLIRAELSEREAALAAFEKARALYAELADDGPAYLLEQGRAENNVGNQLYALGRRDEAVTAYREAQAHLVAAEPGGPREAVNLRAKCLSNLGITLHALNRLGESEEAYREALGLLDALPQPDDDDRMTRARTLSNLGVLLKLRDLAEAERVYGQALAIAEEVAGQRPDYPDYRREVARFGMNLAVVASEQGEPARAEQLVRTALDRLDALATARPAVAEIRSDLASAWDALGTAQRQQEKPEAEQSYRRALEMFRRVVDELPDQPEHECRLAACLINLGMLQAGANRLPQAKETFAEGLKRFDGLLARPDADPEQREQAAQARAVYGNALYTGGELEAALTAHRRGYELYHRLAEESPKAPRLREGEADALMNLGNAYSGLNRLEEALANYEQALRALAPLGDVQDTVRHVRLLRRNCHWGKADALSRLGRHREAVPEWEQMLALIAAEKSQRPFRLQLAESLVRGGNPAAAAEQIRAVTKAEDLPGDQLLEAGRVLALAAGGADSEGAEEYAREAVAVLRRAARAGAARDPRTNAPLDKSGDFAALRERADFKALLAGGTPEP